VKAVLDYAKANGWREGDNPATWAGNLAHALPALSADNHHAALPFAEMHGFMTKLMQHQSIAARALEFCILTAARTNEVVGARWSEFNMQTKVWTIPAERMKAKKEHRVPLSARAMEILKALPREGDVVFIGVRKGKPMGVHAMDVLLKTIRADATVHGFRSSFRDWAAERTRYQNHVVEMALAHSIGNAVEAAYRRGELLEQRSALMNDWSRYCATPPAVNKVTPMRLRA
jgi:integrase